MKFTRFHLLRVLYPTEEDLRLEALYDNRHRAQNVKKLKFVVKYHTIFDLLIIIIINTLIIFTKNHDDITFYNKHAMNVYTIVYASLFISLYYYLVFFLYTRKTDLFSEYSHTYRNILYVAQLYFTNATYSLSILYCFYFSLTRKSIDFDCLLCKVDCRLNRC